MRAPSAKYRATALVMIELRVTGIRDTGRRREHRQTVDVRPAAGFHVDRQAAVIRVYNAVLVAARPPDSRRPPPPH